MAEKKLNISNQDDCNVIYRKLYAKLKHSIGNDAVLFVYVQDESGAVFMNHNAADKEQMHNAVKSMMAETNENN